MTITASTQQAHQKIIAALDSALPLAIAEAVAKESEPLREEVESARKLINETNERAQSEVKTATDALSEKQNEIIGLRGQLEDERAKVFRAADQLAEKQVEIESRDGKLKDLYATITAQTEEIARLSSLKTDHPTDA